MGSLSEIGGRHTEGSRRLFDVCVPRWRARCAGLLPLALVASGHSFFVQQLQLQTGVWPHAVHATYQFEDQADCLRQARAAARVGCGLPTRATPAVGRLPTPVCARLAWRLRAAAGGGGGGGGGALGGGGGGRALSSSSMTTLAPPTRWRPSCRGCPPIRTRAGGSTWRTWSGRASRLADGVLLARVLNRTVVLPQFHCYCDKYWARLTQCTDRHAVARLAAAALRVPARPRHPRQRVVRSWAARKARGRRCARCPRAPTARRPSFPCARTGGSRRRAATASRASAALVPTNERRLRRPRRRRRVAADTRRRRARGGRRGDPDCARRDGARAARPRADGRHARDAAAAPRVALRRARAAALRRL